MQTSAAGAPPGMGGGGGKLPQTGPVGPPCGGSKLLAFSPFPLLCLYVHVVCTWSLHVHVCVCGGPRLIQEPSWISLLSLLIEAGFPNPTQLDTASLISQLALRLPSSAFQGWNHK